MEPWRLHYHLVRCYTILLSYADDRVVIFKNVTTVALSSLGFHLFYNEIGKIKLPHVGFRAHVKIDLVSYRKQVQIALFSQHLVNAWKVYWLKLLLWLHCADLHDLNVLLFLGMLIWLCPNTAVLIIFYLVFSAYLYSFITSIALTLLVRCQEEHPTRVWLSVWSEVQIVCIWSSWCHCIPKPHHLLPHLNPDWFYLSGTGLPRLSWKRGR